jgi:hypothetical protein
MDGGNEAVPVERLDDQPMRARGIGARRCGPLLATAGFGQARSHSEPGSSATVVGARIREGIQQPT